MGELTVFELVEELLHVGVDRGFGIIGRRGRRRAVGRAVSAGLEDLRVSAGLVVEGAELEPSGLVGGEDLVDAEIVFLVLVALDHFRQVDRRAFGRRAALVDPADALLGQLFGGFDADVDAGQGLAVHADQFGDAVEVDAGGEFLHDLFAARGFEPEEGLAAIGALLEDVEAELLPAGHVVERQALGHAGAGLEELHRRVAGVGGELLGKFDQALVDPGVDLGEGLRGFEVVGVAEPADLERDLPGEAQVAPAVLRRDLAQGRGAALEVDSGIDPSG